MDKKCPACDTESFFIKEANYEGFIKIGEIEKCASCGHIIEVDESVKDMKPNPLASIFGDDERPGKVEVFDESDKPQFCRSCVHYIVNPFKQHCGLHNKEVQATDSCPDFDEIH